MNTKIVKIELDFNGYTLEEYIKYLQEKLREIPPEFREEAQLDMWADENDLIHRVIYTRPETLQEAVEREEKMKIRVENQEREELAQFEYLKNKYSSQTQ